MGIPLHQKLGGACKPGGGGNTLSPASSVGHVSHQPLKGKELAGWSRGSIPGVSVSLSSIPAAHAEFPALEPQGH